MSFLIDPEFKINNTLITSDLETVSRWNVLGRQFHASKLDCEKVAESIDQFVAENLDKLTQRQKETLFVNVYHIQKKFSKNQEGPGKAAHKTLLATLNRFRKTSPSNSYSKQASYFDMGGLSSCIWSFITWSNEQNGEVFEADKFNVYLQSLFTQMKNAGMTQIDLAFTQLSDLDALLSGDYSKLSGNDVIGQLLQQMVSSNIKFPKGTDLLKIMTSAANQSGMKIALSFGGENANSSDFTICKTGETPQGQAQKLANFMNTYGIASVDFDVEGSNATALAKQPGAQTFFKSLKQALQGQKTVTLTIQGSLSQTVWGSGAKKNDPSTFNGPLKPLFYNENNQPIFSTLFDGVNLMMYDSGAHYYLDAKIYPDDTVTPDWCIEDWLDIVGKQNAGMIHIGFQDATQYQLAQSSDSGHTYFNSKDPKLAVKTTDSTGTAAAKIFLQIQRTLIDDGYTTPLGSPFWWPNYSGNRYSPDKNDQVHFVSAAMQDFYATLEKLGGKKPAPHG